MDWEWHKVDVDVDTVTQQKTTPIDIMMDSQDLGCQDIMLLIHSSNFKTGATDSAVDMILIMKATLSQRHTQTKL